MPEPAAAGTEAGKCTAAGSPGKLSSYKFKS
ncbi:hypothetical protein NIASO_18865 [Niabella soli DSM 19437]|uniref:Uncharacterized protein n=1 Tax=Niabella soli DSM 19437 TaxID=929713 RepID=W0F4T6_9BACT|nr:hypothetical protein NIASO_18865 [Niabella soli DSM 19437]